MTNLTTGAIGQFWVNNADDDLIAHIEGYKADWFDMGPCWVGMILGISAGVVIPVNTLTSEWNFAGCDHEFACCTIHDHHTTPHKGCILR